MRNEYQDIEQLERYHKGQCSSEEKQNVETRLAKDEDFRGLHDDMEFMIQGLRRTAEGSSIEDKLNLLRETMGDEEDDKNEVINLQSWFTKKRINLSIAATIALLIASLFVFNTVQTSNPDSLFQDYFEPYQNLNSALRDSQQEIDDLTLAYIAYEEGEYEEAARLFESANSKNTELLTHLFYQGNAYLAIGEAEKAISLFQIVSESSSILQDTAEWYLALGYLKARELDKCRELLKKILLANNGFSKRSEDLLKQLK